MYVCVCAPTTCALILQWYRVQQREKLVDILLAKDSSAIVKALEILKNHERGYASLVDKLYANMDDMQKVTSKKPPGKSLYMQQIPHIVNV